MNDRAWPSRVAVVGGGTMGVGIAHVFLASGIRTALVDASPERSEQAHARTLALLEQLEAIGSIDRSGRGRAEASLVPALTLAEAVSGADLVLEAVVERQDVKQQVYEGVEAATDDDAVIATNTSSIPIAQLAAGLRLPRRFLGVHWFVPPLLVPCVEVIAGPATAGETVLRVVDLLGRLGKSPVTVGDGPGFVANRIQFAMFKEAARIVEAGLATPAQVDEVVRSSFGFRLPFFGPFAIADLAGLDVYADIYATLEAELGERFAAPDVLQERVADGALGVKTGRGFLEIDGAQAAALVELRDRAYLALSELRSELEG